MAVGREQTRTPNPTRGRASCFAFPVTAWTLIERAQTSPPAERRQLLDEFIRPYWKPLYALFRSKGKHGHDAQDLVQAFLLDFVEHEKILRVEGARGRFRDFLMTCAENFFISDHRKGRALKRRPGDDRRLLSFQQLEDEDGRPFEPPPDASPRDAYVDAWRRQILDRALNEVRLTADWLGRSLDYEVFADYYLKSDNERPTWVEVARMHGLTDWKEASHRAEWVKRRLAVAVRNQIRNYVQDDEALEAELRELLN